MLLAVASDNSLDVNMEQSAALRRAVYIHVSDLTSAYDIDHTKLEQELARVKADRESSALPQEEEVGVFQQRAHRYGHTTDTDGTVVTIPQKRLQPPRGGYNLCVLVGKVNIVVDKLRVDRSRVRLAEVEVGDETGVVSLRARDDQIRHFQQISDQGGAVVLRNSTIELYQGRHIRLAVTKWGKLSEYPDQIASTPPPPSKMNQDRNFSLIDLSSVASETVYPASDASKIRSPERGEGRGPISSPRNQPVQTSQQQHIRRGGRDRRQQQPRHNAGGTMQVPVTYQDARQALTFSPIQGFTPSYTDALEVHPHYTYPQAPQHRLSQTSAHQAQQIMIQQYELQQRQMQQMQMYQEQQQRHHRSMIGQQQQQQASQIPTPSTVLLPGIVNAGNFERASVNPHLVPMSVPPSQHEESYNVSAAMRTEMQQNESNTVMGDQRIQEAKLSPPPEVSPGTVWNRGPPGTTNALHQQRAESPMSPGTMNPQAISFAPSYVAHHSQGQPANYPYVTFDPSQQAPGTVYSSPPQQHHMYTQGAIYMPAVHTVDQQQYAGRGPVGAEEQQGEAQAGTESEGKEGDTSTIEDTRENQATPGRGTSTK